MTILGQMRNLPHITPNRRALRTAIRGGTYVYRLSSSAYGSLLTGHFGHSWFRPLALTTVAEAELCRSDLIDQEAR